MVDTPFVSSVVPRANDLPPTHHTWGCVLRIYIDDYEYVDYSIIGSKSAVNYPASCDAWQVGDLSNHVCGGLCVKHYYICEGVDVDGSCLGIISKEDAIYEPAVDVGVDGNTNEATARVSRERRHTGKVSVISHRKCSNVFTTRLCRCAVEL